MLDNRRFNNPVAVVFLRAIFRNHIMTWRHSGGPQWWHIPLWFMRNQDKNQIFAAVTKGNRLIVVFFYNSSSVYYKKRISDLYFTCSCPASSVLLFRSFRKRVKNCVGVGFGGQVCTKKEPLQIFKTAGWDFCNISPHW